LSCPFHGLDPLVCSCSALTFENVNPFRHFGRNPWIGDQQIVSPLPTQNSTTQILLTYIHVLSGIWPYDSRVWAFQHVCLRPHGNWDQNMLTLIQLSNKIM